MGVKRRDRLEVVYDILRIVRDHHNSILPTPLLRKSNLSSSSFAEYHDELLEKDFIKEVQDEKGRTYITLTDRGFLFLDKYQLILRFIDEFEL